MATRFLDIFGLEHYHNLITQKMRRIYKQRIVVTTTLDQNDIVFTPNNNYTEDYAYEAGDEALVDVYVNGLRLDMAEYYAWYATSQLHIRLGTEVTGGSISDDAENIIEIVLRK